VGAKGEQDPSLYEGPDKDRQVSVGWTNVFNIPSRYVTATEVNSAFYPPRDGKMSISFRAE